LDLARKADFGTETSQQRFARRGTGVPAVFVLTGETPDPRQEAPGL
jgi:hypothetical protein